MPSYVITGASRGIGLEYVRQLSADKDNVVFAVVRNKAAAHALTSLAVENVHILQADITDQKALKAAALEVEKITGGTLDYLINNAARLKGPESSVLDSYDTEERLAQDLRESYEVNVIGVVFTINAFLPLLRKGSIKKVISLSSPLGDLEFTKTSKNPAQVAYSLSKAALNMAVAKYSVKYADEGFVFLALSPGLVDTFTEALGPAQAEAYNAMVLSFKRVKPSFERALTTQESVRLQLDVIYKSTIKDTGAFISQNGNEDWL